MKNVWPVALIAALALIADVVSKQWALANLHEGIVNPFLPGFLQLTLITNTGGAFGIFREFKIMMTLLPIIICAVIIVWIIARTQRGEPLTNREQIAYGLLLGGASGNIIERVMRGHVTDFLEFSFITFPIFNVADALIDTGVALILILSFANKKSAPGPSQSSRSGGQ